MKRTRLFGLKITILTLVLCLAGGYSLRAQQSPVSDDHINRINSSLKENGIRSGYVTLDPYGRLKLEGEYVDEKEVDRAFSIAQTVVGIRWVSPVTPENIKVKEWERRLGNLFSRANVLKPKVKEGTTPGPVRNRYALVAGIGQFKEKGITPLNFAVKDATSFYHFLTDPRRGNFPRSNVIYLTDRGATRDSISRAFNEIVSKAQEDDLVVIYMSSHGTPPDKFGGVYVVTYDTEVKPRERVWHTAISETMIKDFTEKLRARRLVMLLDTCYSNGAYRSVPGFLPAGGKSLGADENEGYGISKEYGKRLLGSKDIVLDDDRPKATAKTTSLGPEDSGWGTVLISASGSGEQSWESDKLNNSVFTYYFVEGLNKYNGALEPAFSYAKPRTTQRVKQEKGQEIDQTPAVMATNQNWNMPIAYKK